MRRFEERFGLSSEMKVLDVGGTTFNWNYVREKPDLVLLNVLSPGVFDMGDVKLVIGDGRQMPFRADQFDIVFSNSVIEHVGSQADQERFAEDC
ncbi:MAG: methyltransferase domain-containing protein, partial [Rhodothermales bacterium]|nr:methyltransferase domain-containing protein [Rhodothermales bacterium]